MFSQWPKKVWAQCEAETSSGLRSVILSIRVFYTVEEETGGPVKHFTIVVLFVELVENDSVENRRTSAGSTPGSWSTSIFWLVKMVSLQLYFGR